MSAVIPTVLSPARVSHALASVGPPAGSGALHLSSTDPLAPFNAADIQRIAVGITRQTSPSRAAATSFPVAIGTPSSPHSIDVALSSAAPLPHTPSHTVASHASGGAAAAPYISTHRASGSGTGDPSSTATSARSLNGRRPQTARPFRSRPDSPKPSSGRVQLAADNSSTSLSTTQVGHAGSPGPSPVQRAFMSNSGTNRGSRGGLGRDRSFGGSVSSTTGQFRPQHGSTSGGLAGVLDSVGSSIGGLGRGGPVVLQPAPGTIGGIDVARLAAIQRLLDEYDSDEERDPLASSPRGEGSSSRQHSDSAGGDSIRHGGSDSGSGNGSASGLRTIASLRARKDMQNWQPAVSTVKCSLEEHQQRLRERADVTQHLKRWAEQVLEDARRAADGGSSARVAAITRAASVRFKDAPEEPGSSAPAAVGEFLDPEQELDDEEERRMEALMALPPNPRGLGAQLRAHFMAVVEDEVNKKFDVIRAKWEVEKAIEADELRELRESYRDLRRMHIETKDALDKANTRLDVMRLQMKATASMAKTGKEATTGPGAAEGDGNVAGVGSGPKSSLRSNRSSTHDGSEGKAGGKGGKGTASGAGGDSAAHSGEVSGAPGGHDDDLHDKLKNVGSRRPTSATGDGSGANAAAAAEMQQQLRAQTDAAMSLNRKLQEAEQQVAKLKQDKVSLENQLVSAQAAKSTSPEPGSAGSTGTGGKYDADVQIFKLKQEKASLEQQLVAAKAKASSKGSGKSASSSGTNRGVSASRAPTVASGKSAAGAKTAELTAEVERLQIELAAAKREMTKHAKEATERQTELQKAKDDLASKQAALDMALQQITSFKDAMAREKERADKAATAAEAAEAAQAQAEASAAAANSAVASALIKRSAATGEVQELLQRLEKERDAAVAAAAELRQQVREMSKSLEQQAEDLMQLREEMLQRQLEKPMTSTEAEHTEVATAATPPAPAASPAAESLPRPPSLVINSSAMNSLTQAKVTAAAVAAMQSLGISVRSTPAAARRRPTSALGPSGAAGAAGLEGAVGVAAAAAAAAALVPAVLDVLRQSVPDMVVTLDGEWGVGDSTMGGKPSADVDDSADIAASAAAAAAAAAAATLRESGNAAAAAAAGATAAAPIIASTFVALVRSELLHGDFTTSLPGGVAAMASAFAKEPARGSSSGAGTRAERPDLIMSRSVPQGDLVSEQLDQLSALNSDRLYVFHKGTPPTVIPPVSSGAGLSVSFADDSTSPSPSATTGAASPSGVGGERSASPPAVVLDGVTFYPLGVRGSVKAARRSGGLSAILSGGHEIPRSPQWRSPPPSPSQPPLPHHTPYFDAAAAAVAAAAADLLPQSVSVSVQPSCRSLLSTGVAAASRRRKSVFAQLHSSYFTPMPSSTAPSSAPDSGSPTVATSDIAPDEDGEGLAAAAAAAMASGGFVGGGGPRIRIVRSAGYARDTADGPILEPYYSMYVDPELASVLHVERVSPAAARAAGAGRGAISPEALGPSLRDRALSALQAPEPLPPPQQRPQSAAVRTMDAARQCILNPGSGGGSRYSPQPPLSFATLPPVAGALPLAASAEVPGPALAEGGGSGGVQTQQSAPLPLGLLMSGVKVRTTPANPQKGVQLSPRLRPPRQPSARASGSRNQPEGVRFGDEEGTGPSVSGRLLPGIGLAPPMREVQLHIGLPHGGSTSSATYSVSADAATVGGEGGGGGGLAGDSGDGCSELPSSGPELAALARSLMAAQDRAVKELEEAMSTRRELAEEVLTSRQQWLDEARRARALENELDGVRAMLVSLGIGAAPQGWPSGGGGGGGGGGGPPGVPRPSGAGISTS